MTDRALKIARKLVPPIKQDEGDALWHVQMFAPYSAFYFKKHEAAWRRNKAIRILSAALRRAGVK